MDKYLITGAGGFIGSNLLRSLIGEGAGIVALVRKGTKNWRLSGVGGMEIEEVDLLDAGGLMDVFIKHRPTHVYHLGTHGAYPRQKDAAAILETNLIGSYNVMKASRASGVRNLLYLGSSGEYGFLNRPICEEDGLNPNCYYAVGKAAASLLFKYESTQPSGPCIRIARLFSAYGPFEDPFRLMPQVVFNGLRGCLPNSLGDPDSARDYLYIDDLISALKALMGWSGGVGGEVVNIASGVQTRLSEVIEVASEIFGVEESPEWGSHTKAIWDSKNWQADISKVSSLLGWYPKVNLEDGLRKFADMVTHSPIHQELYGKILNEKGSI